MKSRCSSAELKEEQTNKDAEVRGSRVKKAKPIKKKPNQVGSVDSVPEELLAEKQNQRVK